MAWFILSLLAFSADWPTCRCEVSSGQENLIVLFFLVHIISPLIREKSVDTYQSRCRYSSPFFSYTSSPFTHLPDPIFGSYKPDCRIPLLPGTDVGLEVENMRSEAPEPPDYGPEARKLSTAHHSDSRSSFARAQKASEVVTEVYIPPASDWK